MSQETFSGAMEAFFRALRRTRARWGQDHLGGLSIPQYSLLVPLRDEDEPLSLRELAIGAHVSAPTASRMVDGLERDGLVRRRPSERDRRCVLVELTPAGRAALDEASAELTRVRGKLYRALTADERVEAERMLLRLTEIIEAT